MWITAIWIIHALLMLNATMTLTKCKQCVTVTQDMAAKPANVSDEDMFTLIASESENISTLYFCIKFHAEVKLSPQTENDRSFRPLR